MVFILLMLAACFYGSLAKESLDGFKVFRLSPTSEEQTEYLLQMEEEDNTLNFWSGVNNVGIPVDVMVKPENQEKFDRTMDSLKIPVKDMIEHVQERIDAKHVQTLYRAGMNWNGYYKLEDIYSWFDELAVGNSAVSLLDIGLEVKRAEV